MKRAWYIGLTLNVLLAVTLLGAGTWYFTRPATVVTEVNTVSTATKATVARPIVKAPTLTSTEVIQFTNDYRATKGLAPLVENELLNQSACAKAQHMVDNNYWAHIAPDGTQPWYFMDQAGYVYAEAGENLAYGYASSFVTVYGWENSPEHEKNLSGNYTETGVCVKTDITFQGKLNTTLVVAHYGL